MFRRAPSDRPEPLTCRLAAGRLALEVAGGSVVGHRYPANFDVLHVDATLPFVAVVDGMGSGEGARVAGTTTMTTLVEAVRNDWPAVGARELRAAVADARSLVRAAGARLTELTGCTLTPCWSSRTASRPGSSSSATRGRTGCATACWS
ncbi:hypothetical protein [Micromonospora sp. 4G55]|uniref:hypothetical protein n=1 Tax=Micromonospora sp. 4G55 TaxID=2806102 RepID=UPI001EE4E433|nr:hypothetical protein [Micromonospora sp. 4G55]